VAKILVADDNSNIQKMVGLALKDHGIDVVAVGNGEAAVRKISDVRPDLVLADVFMPVRNGYEVCKYVKDDTALSHIPVILLVGAFDPLDEQEAQRVGADGVLKKPFVPPDPLISMVKSALVRAGVAHAGFAPAKPVAEAAAEVPEAPPAPRRSVPTLTTAPAPTLPDFDSTESFVEEVPARPVGLTIDSEKQPVAFGSLLKTPGADIDQEPNEVTAEPALERDWRTEEVEEEEDEDDSKRSWRRDVGSDESDDEAAASGSRWREADSDDDRKGSKKHSAWSPTREREALTEAAELQENVNAAATDFRNMPVAPFSGEAWAAAIEAGAHNAENKIAVAEEEHPTPHATELEALVGHSEPAQSLEQQDVQRSEVREQRESEAQQQETRQEQSFISEPEKAPEPAPVQDVATAPAVVTEAEKPNVGISSWFSTPPSPWDAEAQKASRLASTWDAAVAPAATQSSAHESLSSTSEIERSFLAAPEPDEIEIVSGASPNSAIPEAVETAREEASHSATDVDMDAVVAKVMARMSPDKLQEVTRDLLKPVIEAIVREELNKKS
jgi:CheY-like chemotaxis protein